MPNEGYCLFILSLPKLEYSIDVVERGHYHSYHDSGYRDGGYKSHHHNSYKRLVFVSNLINVHYCSTTEVKPFEGTSF